MRGWVVGLVVAVALTVGGAVALIVIATGSSSTAIVDLDTGDCFDLPDESELARFETVDLIDCDEPHEVEVVLTGELNPDGDLPYPDDEALFELVDRRCATVAATVATSLDDHVLLPLAPTADTWDGADGRFSCLAYPLDGEPQVGSITVDRS